MEKHFGGKIFLDLLSKVEKLIVEFEQGIDSPATPFCERVGEKATLKNAESLVLYRGLRASLSQRRVGLLRRGKLSSGITIRDQQRFGPEVASS